MPSLGERLVFVLGPPRSGSTLLTRILHATGFLYARPEPHLLTPLAWMGYHGRVHQAPYDPVRTQQAIRAFVGDLPRGEADHLDALRAYCDVMYGRMMERAGPSDRYFLDKTPSYALMPGFVARLFPQARYVVLTRHPAALVASQATTFFDGDFEAASRFNPLISRYVPPLARFLRERPVPLVHVRYEDLVSQPHRTLEQLSLYLGIPFDPGALQYTRRPMAPGFGDPTGVPRWDRPVTESLDGWARRYAGRPDRIRVVARQVARVSDGDLEAWGTPRSSFWEPVERARPEEARRRTWDRWSTERRLLLWARKGVAALRSLPLTDALLREAVSPPETPGWPPPPATPTTGPR